MNDKLEYDSAAFRLSCQVLWLLIQYARREVKITLSKNDNMLAILWMLSSSKKITAKQIAEKLELNIRTVYRYIDALNTSGVPIISDSGHNGGYSLINDFHQAPLVFDIEEKKALLYATTHAKDSGYPFSDALSSAIEKLRLFSTEEQARILNRHIVGFEVAKQHIVPSLKALLEELTVSIANQQAIEIEYRTKSEEQHRSRVIDPYGILYWCSKWYVVGFCHLRGEIRSFRVERITKMTHTESVFVRPKDFSAKAFFLRSLIPEMNNNTTIIPLVIGGRAEALDDLCNHWFMSHHLKERTLNQAVFLIDNNVIHNHVAHFLLTYGKSIQVIEPTSCKEKLYTIAVELMEYYQI